MMRSPRSTTSPSPPPLVSDGKNPFANEALMEYLDSEADAAAGSRWIAAEMARFRERQTLNNS
jgi:hypothetical protein